MSLFWNLDITKGQGTGKIGPQKWTFIMSVFFFMYFTITGVKNIVQQQHFFTMTIPDFSYALHFSVWHKKVKGGDGERRIWILLHISLPLISRPLWKRRATEISCCFHSYLFWLAHRPLLSIRKVNGTFHESLSCWSDVCAKMSIVFYTNLCPCLAL